MARIRSIKPEFFTDEEVARLPPLYRIAFVGLWCQADKAGRLEDRPTRLKVQILPYDDVNFVEVLDALVAARFALRYTGPDGRAYLQIRTFEKNQRPRTDEAESDLPPLPPELLSADSCSLLGSDETVSGESVGKERKGIGKEGNGGGSTSAAAPAQAVVNLWNELVTTPIPKVTKLTQDRKAKIDARLKTYPDLAVWRTVITWINTQDWCRAPGRGEHPNWTATLDWLCKNDGVIQRHLERATTELAASRSVRTYEPWICPHVDECSNARICANATLLNRPRKAGAA